MPTDNGHSALASFQTELQSVLNKHCIDSLTNIPDFILAHYLTRSIANLQMLRTDEYEWRNL